MALRCIYCNRSEKQIALSESFTCIDRKDCDAFIERRNKFIRHSNQPLKQHNQPRIIVSIFFDCACDGPNLSGGCPLGVGVATYIFGKYSEDHSGIKAVEWGTVNDGEWIAFLYALHVAKIMKEESANYRFKIFGDSQVVVNHFNTGKMAKKFIPYKQKADKLKSQLGGALLSVSWVPREQNSQADKLSKDALLLHK